MTRTGRTSRLAAALLATLLFVAACGTDGGNTKDASPATKPKKGYSKASQSTVGGSIGNLHDGYAANESSDLSSSC